MLPEPTRMAVIKKGWIVTNVGKDVENWSHHTVLVGM